MYKSTSRILLAALATAASCFASYTTFDFSLIPSDGISQAEPGGTFGWGYSVTNSDPDNWLSLTGLQPTINFQYVTGITDIFDYPTIAPGDSVLVPWMQDTAGLYQVTWDASAPPNYSASGQFAIDATWYYADPNLCPTCLVDGPAQTQEVADFTAVAAPEPSTFGLSVIAIALCAHRWRKRNKIVHAISADPLLPPSSPWP